MTTEEIITWKKNFPNILEKARSKANRRYPSILEIDDDAEFGEHDINEAKRDIFIEGYLEAEKDLGLTWEDIERIEHYCEQVNREHNMGTFRGTPYGKSFYKEVSRRFNKAKEE